MKCLVASIQCTGDEGADDQALAEPTGLVRSSLLTFWWVELGWTSELPCWYADKTIIISRRYSAIMTETAYWLL